MVNVVRSLDGGQGVVSLLVCPEESPGYEAVGRIVFCDFIDIDYFLIVFLKVLFLL